MPIFRGIWSCSGCIVEHFRTFRVISVSVSHVNAVSKFYCNASRDLAVSWTSSANMIIPEFSALSLFVSMRSARTSMNMLKSVGLMGEPRGTPLVISAKSFELDPAYFVHPTVINGSIWRNIPSGSIARRMLMSLFRGTLL